MRVAKSCKRFHPPFGRMKKFVSPKRESWGRRERRGNLNV
jgi:hypothetical protein